TLKKVHVSMYNTQNKSIKGIVKINKWVRRAALSVIQNLPRPFPAQALHNAAAKQADHNRNAAKNPRRFLAIEHDFRQLNSIKMAQIRAPDPEQRHIGRQSKQDKPGNNKRYFAL